MTPKQRRFVDEYMQDFNATQAAIRAGYSERTAGSIGWENLQKPEIESEIQRRVNVYGMNAHERLVILSEIARGVGERTSDRIKAIELLGKLAGDYVDRVENSGETTIRVVYGDDG